MTLNDLAELVIYPIEKLLVLMGSIQIGGVSLLSLMIGATVLGMIYHFFVGQHSSLGKGGFSSGRVKHSSGGSDSSDN